MMLPVIQNMLIYIFLLLYKNLIHLIDMLVEICVAVDDKQRSSNNYKQTIYKKLELAAYQTLAALSTAFNL